MFLFIINLILRRVFLFAFLFNSLTITQFYYIDFTIWIWNNYEWIGMNLCFIRCNWSPVIIQEKPPYWHRPKLCPLFLRKDKQTHLCAVSPFRPEMKKRLLFIGRFFIVFYTLNFDNYMIGKFTENDGAVMAMPCQNTASLHGIDVVKLSKYCGLKEK